jgi:outer membrane lipoprotein-sorting protein
MRKHFLPVFCSLLLIPALTGVAYGQALTADQIVERHLTALGGREALGKITSRRATGTVSVPTPAGALSGPLEMLAKTPNKVRIEMRIDTASVGGPGEMVITQMFDGTTGWSVNSMQGEMPFEGDQLAGARNNFFPSPLLRYKELAAGGALTAAVEASQQVNGKPAHVILFTPKTGPAERMFFDADSFLHVRTTASVTLPQVGRTDVVSELSDYRTVDGVKVPFVLVQSAGDQTVTMTFTKVENNVPLDDALFVKR